MPSLSLLVYHHALLIAGCSMLGLLWGAGGAPREIPRGIFFLLGVVSPLVQMFLSILLYSIPYRSFIFLLCPISFSFLWLLSLGARRNLKAKENHDWEHQIREIEGAIPRMSDNAALHLRKAELLEKAGIYDKAVDSYRKIHQMSAATLSAFELRQVEDRLGPATRLQLMHRQGSSRRFQWLPAMSYGWMLCFAAASPVWFLDQGLFFGVLFVWLFVLWCNTRAAQNW